ERVGLNLRPEALALKQEGGNFLALVTKAAATPYSLILMTSDATLMKGALDIAKAKKPLIYAATAENVDAFGALAKEYACPLAVKAGDVEGLVALTEKLA